jgi:hypothetical protein
VRRADERPLAAHLLEPPQEKLPKSAICLICPGTGSTCSSASRKALDLAHGDVQDMSIVSPHNVEVVCSDAAEHRRPVESREPDIAGHAHPTWQDVVECDYHDWDRDRLVVDIAASDVTAGVRAIVGHVSAQASCAQSSAGE